MTPPLPDRERSLQAGHNAAVQAFLKAMVLTFLLGVLVGVFLTLVFS